MLKHCLAWEGRQGGVKTYSTSWAHRYLDHVVRLMHVQLMMSSDRVDMSGANIPPSVAVSLSAQWTPPLYIGRGLSSGSPREQMVM